MTIRVSEITGVYARYDGSINDASSSLPYLDWGRGVTPQNR